MHAFGWLGDREITHQTAVPNVSVSIPGSDTDVYVYVVVVVVVVLLSVSNALEFCILNTMQCKTNYKDISPLILELVFCVL